MTTERTESPTNDVATTPLETALSYAARGWHVFPLFSVADGACTCGRSGCSSPGKHPRTRRGLHDATADATTIERWWSLWPGANIGIATGHVSALAVIDLDLPEANESLHRLEELGNRLSPTLTGVTGAGRHLYFTTQRALSNTTRRLPGIDEDLPGIDLRADGGYVVAPPSNHINGTTYRWLDHETEPAPLPHWIRVPEHPPSPSPMGSAPALTGDGTPYGLAALRDEIDRLSHTPEGGRNDQLNRAAFALGQLVAGAELDDVAARAALQETAQRIGLDQRETQATIESGFRAGKLEPRRAIQS